MEPRDTPFSLIHHEASLRKHGLALSFPWEPFPSNCGPSSMGHAMGATLLGGMDALLNPTTMEGLEPTPVVGSSLRQR